MPRAWLIWIKHIIQQSKWTPALPVGICTPQRAISLLTKTAWERTITRCQGHHLNAHSPTGFLAVFPRVLPRLECEASLPLQTGRRRRMILRLTSLGRREGEGTRTPSRKRVLAVRVDLLHPSSVLGCFLSLVRIWMRLGLDSSLLKDLLGRTFADHIPSAQESSSRRAFWERTANDASRVAFLGWWMNHFSSPTREKPIAKALKARNQ